MSDPSPICRTRPRPAELPPITARTRTRAIQTGLDTALDALRPARGWPNQPEWMFMIRQVAGKLVAHTVFAPTVEAAREIIPGYMEGEILRCEPCTNRNTYFYVAD